MQHQFPVSNKIELELTSKCTIKCPNCPRTYQQHRRKEWDNGNIKEDDLIEFLHSTNAYDFRLAGAYGDALYHPQLIKVIKAIKSLPNGRFIFDTNGSYRKKEDWEAIGKLVNKQDFIVFSIDGTPENFTKYRVNADWPSIKIGVETLVSYGARLRWKYIVFKYNQSFEDMKLAYDTARELGFFQFVVVHTHRAPPEMLANKEEFDKNLTKLEEYVYMKEKEALAYYGKFQYQKHITRLKIAITPRTSQFKIKEIIENKDPEAHNLRIKDKTTKVIDIENKPGVKELELKARQLNKFAQQPIRFKKEAIETKSVFPQCMNMENYTNFISSEGLYLPCCFMRVDQKNNFKEAGITDEDVKSLSIYENTRDEIISGVAFKKIMNNFENITICNRICPKSKVKPK
jgi:MoaA/NifB/PqqE/SkfB family radical SAM enzyme